MKVERKCLFILFCATQFDHFSMASSSSSSSVQQKFQVFLSFRGEDTRVCFTSHLHAALKCKGINAYVDYQLEKGERINTLLTAIEESTISIIILSENYASSSWCLDELSKILECQKTMGQKVVPIFYHVDPSDVRKQKGSFEEAFAKQQERFKDTTDKVDRWRAAFVEVADLSGFHLTGKPNDRLESEVVKEIAQDISEKLMCNSSVDTNPLVGIASRVNEIESLLCMDSIDVCCVGIWGMGGIGKTTIAEVVYQRFAAKFDGKCFVNVTEELKHGPVHLRQKLFSKILGDKNLNVGTSLLHASIIDRLQRKKVFIVLDDVNDSEQLDLLSKNFGPGSRIIVTSRDKQLLETLGVCVKHVMYEVRGLIDGEALQLFSWYAFGQKHPEKDFVELSKEVVHYAKGVPLVLRVVGSALYGKSKCDWEGHLNKLKKFPDLKIDNMLKMRYDGLHFEEENHIFLDIACFFRGKNMDYVENILGGCYISVRSGISTLVDKSLITISYNRLEMHDLLQHMAWNIIRQESNNPGQRSRLWTSEDICHLLEHNTGTESVKGMLLDMSKISRRVFISPTAFARMYNLKFLKFYYSDSKSGGKLLLENGLVTLPCPLSYLHWDEYRSKSLPSNFVPENLVELNMPNSHVEQLWDGVQNLVKLKWLDLRYSQYLIKIPDLSKATNLKEIILKGCKKLENFPSSVRLRSLKTLDLKGCSNITKFPDIPKNLQWLILDRTAIEEVPSSIGCGSGLKHLYLRDCRRLEILSSSICKLKFLEKLDLDGCINLESFPEILETMECLKYLDLCHTSIEELPSSIENLVGLIYLELDYCKKLKNLPSSIRELKSLHELSLISCSNVTKFPEISENLNRLNLSGTSIEQLPPSINCYSNLQWLDLDNCTKLVNLPMLKSFLGLTVSGFSKLEVIKEFLGTVEVLNIHPSNETAKIFMYKRQRCLSVDFSLFAFPSCLMYMSSLTTLNLSRNDFETMPGCIKQLLQLHTLDLRYCKRLQSLPPELPPQIQYLDARDCKSLEAVSSAFPINCHKDQMFMFTNCLKLDQNCINWVKTPLSIQQKAIKAVNLYHEKVELYHEDSDEDYVKEPNPKSSLSICFPGSGSGSEIPEWFSHKSQGCSVTIQLPLHLHDDNKFVGFTVCAVLAFSDDFCTFLNSISLHLWLREDFRVSCQYKFNTNGDDILHFPCSDNFRFNDFPFSKFPKSIDSDHVLIGYHLDFYRVWYKEKSNHHLNEASFKFSIRKCSRDLSDYCVVKECGVCLLYAQDDFPHRPVKRAILL